MGGQGTAEEAPAQTDGAASPEGAGEAGWSRSALRVRGWGENGLPPGARVRIIIPRPRRAARLRRDEGGTLSLTGWERPSADDAWPSVAAWLEGQGLVLRRLAHQGGGLRVDAVAPASDQGEDEGGAWFQRPT